MGETKQWSNPMLVKVPVFYDERMAAPATGLSPSAAKPRLVVEDWLACRRENILLFPFAHATVAEIEVAHDPGYVADVLSCKRANGFGTYDGVVARSLPWTVGSMLAAARCAVKEGRGAVVCSPTSGFHHAHRSRGRGFCTFNGLAIAALNLLNEGAKSIGILDCDFHYGDGTDDILGHDPRVVHRTAGELHTGPGKAEEFRYWLSDSLRAMRWCDVILYQAGADQHIDDPLGGMLTDWQMSKRDLKVMRWIDQYEVPLVWNLAGGYQRDPDGGISKVLDLHRMTLDAHIARRGQQ